jgi:hypothetical protein
MKLVTGNIFDAPLRYGLVIPVNTAGVPGAGLARAAARFYPGWANSYKTACKRKDLRNAGDVILHFDARNPRPVMVSFATKGRDWKKASTLSDISRGLDTLALALVRQNLPLAVPALGCGLGELDFYLDVWNLLDRKLSLFDVLVYEPRGGVYP